MDRYSHITLNDLVAELQKMQAEHGNDEILSIGAASGQIQGLNSPFCFHFKDNGVRFVAAYHCDVKSVEQNKTLQGRHRFSDIGLAVEGEKHILEDLVNFVREAEHEGIDPGNTISDLVYSIEVGLELNGMGRDVPEEEDKEPSAPVKSRLDLLEGYKCNEAMLKTAEELKKQEKTAELIGKIKALKPRIDELINTGNACLRSGIPMTGSAWGGHEGYDTHQFFTNSWSHLVGFVGGFDEIEFVGINAGGACGKWNFRTDGERVFSQSANEISDPSIADMEKFLNKFDEFETAFYAYVDKVIVRQQASIDDVLADARRSAAALGKNASELAFGAGVERSEVSQGTADRAQGSGKEIYR